MIVTERLGQDVIRPKLHGLNTDFQCREGGQHNDEGVGGSVLDGAEHFQSAHSPRHLQVRQDHIKDFPSGEAQRLFAVLRNGHLIAGSFQDRGENLPHPPFVIHDQNLRRSICHYRTSCSIFSITASARHTEVPRPATLSTETVPRCSSMIRCTTASPRPVPPGFVVKNG